jgi:hypothetical protein
MNNARSSFLDKKLPAFTGFFVLLIALGTTVFLSGNAVLFVTKATVGTDPKNIQLSNLAATSFTISYTTDAPATGSITYGTDTTLSEIALDDRDQQASGAAEHQIHFITVKNLTPGTKYYYAILSGSQKEENNGTPFTISTSAVSQTQSASQTLAGSVSLSDGSIPAESIVYVTANNAEQLATLVSADGSYQLPLSDLQSNQASQAGSLPPDTVLQLQAVTATQQSSAKVLLSQADLVPKIIIPQNYDFTLGTSQNPQLQQSVGSGSAFPVLSTPAPVSSPEITTPTDDQAFKDQQPLFTGRALNNTEVDITIHSTQEISTKVISDGSGIWQFRPPVTLAPGGHTITISSLDVSGIVQTVTRSFTVYASGSKFVEPSVSPISPTVNTNPTAIPTPTTAPTSTPTMTPTEPATPTIIPTAPVTQKTTAPTSVPVPKTGSSAAITGLFAGVSILSIGALLIFLSVV